MIVGDAANFLLGGIPGDVHDIFVMDVEPDDLIRASALLVQLRGSVSTIHVKLSGSVAALEGKWQGDGAGAFESEIWQPLSHGLGVLERECGSAASELARLAVEAEQAHLYKVTELSQEIQNQLWLYAGTSMIGAPELGAVIGDAVTGLAARLGGELVGRMVAGIVDAIGRLLSKVLDAFYDLLKWAAKPLTVAAADLRIRIDSVFSASMGTPSLGQGATNAVGGWAGTNMSPEESFIYHFERHGSGMSEAQYDAAAQEWAKGPKRPGTAVQLRDGSRGTRYRSPGGGPGGILDSQGNVVTFWTH